MRKLIKYIVGFMLALFVIVGCASVAKKVSIGPFVITAFDIVDNAG